MSQRFVRVAETGRTTFAITVDGVAMQAAEGDTLMVALLTTQDALRDSEFGDGRVNTAPTSRRAVPTVPG